MSDETGSPANAGLIETVPLADALGERYLAYALSTITSRSLPDVRDGLKPVQRRLLYAMRQLKLDPAQGFKKCARVVGDVIGKYHPHGDTAVYDAMVRLAQDFALRYPLVDGQGNFGNIDGDNAAAMRYTEARLTEVAMLLLQDLDRDTVGFRANYDGTDEEPVVLPAGFPNLLANGATGIAVGMATSIPPHNAAELAEAARMMLGHRKTDGDFPDGTAIRPEDRYRDCPHETLLSHVQGPDFPTGGVLVESKASIAEAYATGRGGFRVRARWHREDLAHGRYQIVVTEIPFQVQKGRLIERVAELLTAKKLALLADIRDESAEDVRIVLEPRSRDVDPALLMESLFRQSDFENRFSLNMNVLDAEGVPQVMSLRGVLAAFIEHRIEVLRRRTRHRLSEIARRLEVLQGQLIAYLNLDEVIHIIRTADEPKAGLMTRFELTEVQAEAILNMRLRALHKLQQIEIERESKQLTTEQKKLKGLLADEGRQRDALDVEFADLVKRFGPETELGRRRTTPGEAPKTEMVSIEALVEREPITVVLSTMGWIRAMKGHIGPDQELRFKEGDAEALRIEAQTTDRILVFADDGRVYTLQGDKLPPGRGFGEPLRLMVDLAADAQIVTLTLAGTPGDLLLVASDGRGFMVKPEDAVAQTRTGRQVLVPGEGQKLKLVRRIDADATHLAIVGENRKLAIYPIDQVPHMTRGKGVRLQTYRQGGPSDVRGLKLVEPQDGLSWQRGPQTRKVLMPELARWITKARGGPGALAPNGFPRDNRFGD